MTSTCTSNTRWSTPDPGVDVGCHGEGIDPVSTVDRTPRSRLSRRAATLRALGVACAAMVAVAGVGAAERAASGQQAGAQPSEVRRTASAASADLAKDSTYLLPGTAFGPHTTLASLRRQFGAANVAPAELDGAEGETARGIVVFADDPLRRADVFMRDEQRLVGVATLRVTGVASRWHLDSGVRPGMTLAALVKANGAPVSFYGLKWDYGGTIVDWHGGKLAPGTNAPVVRAASLTSIEGARDGSYPIGDGTFRSDDRHHPAQGTALVVGEISVSWPDGE